MCRFPVYIILNRGLIGPDPNQTKPRAHPAKKVRKEGKRLSWVEVEGPNFRSPVPTKKMNQRKSAAGRPSGTDGSDFAYRMVVDSRYQKVAKGKSRLSTLILNQVVIQLCGMVYLFILTSKRETPDKLAISSAVTGFLSLFLGELGRRRSRASFLKAYMIASSLALLLLFVNVSQGNYTFEGIEDLSNWQTKKLELLETIRIFLGALLQIFAIRTVISLVGNMSLPKRSS
ncbi:hypothetical protein SDJN03_05402, partial [Cucurbita argyrosperma subsp. sororia]